MSLIRLNHRPVRNYDAFVNEFFSFPTTLPEVSRKSTVPANIYETKEAFHLDLNVPGRKKEDFKVNVEKNLLTVSYENVTEKVEGDVKNIRTEYKFESFTRSFSIDESIDAEKIEAKYENGLLKFTLPKVEEKKPQVKTIAIQ